jgi:hypothetical protein
MESQETGEFVYEINFYYGVHYPITEVQYVCEALASTKFAALTTDDSEINIGDKLFLRNANSDADETRGIIFPDDMSVQGGESDSPAAYCKFDPSQLTESEESNKDCVEIITDIYDIIVAHYKKTGRGVKNLYLGWYVYNCEWSNDESGEESSEEPVPKSASKKGGKDNKASQGKKVNTTNVDTRNVSVSASVSASTGANTKKGNGSAKGAKSAKGPNKK